MRSLEPGDACMRLQVLRSYVSEDGLFAPLRRIFARALSYINATGIAVPPGRFIHTLSCACGRPEPPSCILITVRHLKWAMARTEQIVTDRKTMRELVAFMEEAVREGLTKEEITSQIDLMLDKPAKA